jgi:hypothetical protein
MCLSGTLGMTEGIGTSQKQQKFNPRARVFIYRGTTNIGDAIQAVALTRLLGEVCAGVYRDSPLPDQYSDVPFVVNGWIGYKPPSSGRNCIFAGVHLGDYEQRHIEWIRKAGGVVGARDTYTRGLLATHRVASEVISCATLTLPRYRGPRRGRYSVDIEPIPGTQYETNVIPDLCWSDEWELALHRLDQLRKAEVVYTKRIHVLLPCLAFGTPVVFPSEEFRDLFDKTRLTILHDLGFVHDEPIEMDVSPIAERYIEFLENALNAPVRPADEPVMPIPMEPPVADNGVGQSAGALEVSPRRHEHYQVHCQPPPTVSALVMTRNGAKRLPNCLESIRRTGFA